MILHNDPLLCIYFGDARDALMREMLDRQVDQDRLWQYPELSKLKKIMSLDSLVLLKQVHGDSGKVILSDKISDVINLRQEGDYIITKLDHLGLGVYTADCLPIIFFDTYNLVIGICHAGWAGSLKSIGPKTVEKMKEQFGTDLDYLRIFFGPSAKVCCYAIDKDSAKTIKEFNFENQVLIKHSNKIYFDLPLFNKLQLEQIGIKKEAFHCTYNICTICDKSFCSYKRDGQKAKRQLTVVALK